MRNVCVLAPLIVATGTLSTVVHGQSAIIAVTHNRPTGVVQPGETVRITATLSWIGAIQAATIAGDLNASPNQGTAANPEGAWGWWSAPPNFGTPTAGSIMGVDLRVNPWFFVGAVSPYVVATGLEFVWYDWTAPSTTGTVEFNWVPHPEYPNPLFYLTFMTEVRSPLPTTYSGTSITVIPAPVTMVTLLAFGACASSRRRR